MFITPEVAYVCELLHKYDVLPLECDGHTMVVSCLLDRFCIPHQRIVGEVTLAGTGQIIRPHLWIEYDEYIIDYRLRMWARKTEDNVSLVPHGIFIEDKNSPYVNIIVTREDNKDAENVKEFMQSYQSPEVAKAAETIFNGGAVPGW